MITNEYSSFIKTAVIGGTLVALSMGVLAAAVVHGQESSDSTIGVESERLEADVTAAPADGEDYVGLSEAAAKARASENEVMFRVVERDGEMLPRTRDYRPGRINAVVVDGQVVAYTVEGEESAETNVCDGVTCADGSCAATAAACSATAPAEGATCPTGTPVLCPDGSCRKDTAACPAEDADTAAGSAGETIDTRTGEPIDADSDGDGLDDGTERVQNHNSSRSNRTTGAAAPDFNDPDDDGDTMDDSAERANYNNSRSNKSVIAAPEDPDTNVCDGVTCSDGSCAPTQAECAPGDANAMERIDWEELNGENTTETNVAASGRADSTVESATRRNLLEKLQAVETSVPRTMHAQGRLQAAPGGGGGGGRIKVAINAPELQTLTESERADLEQLVAGMASNTPEYASLRIAQQTLQDDRIERVAVSSTSTRLTYRARMNLFGVLPLERTVQAQSAVGGDTTIAYPWYAVLATTPDTETMQRAIHDMQVEMQMTLMADPI